MEWHHNTFTPSLHLVPFWLLTQICFVCLFVVCRGLWKAVWWVLVDVHGEWLMLWVAAMYSTMYLLYWAWQIWPVLPVYYLISSLADIGICGPLLRWLSDYLTGRQQWVVLDGTVSHPAPVNSGVPQGSILGPLLFNIHMNSISSLPLSQNARLILYADDILLFNSAADVAHLQQDVNLILSWMDTHGLTPNHSKTKLLPIIRTKRPLSINIFMGSHPIPPCKSVKYLGVAISSNLTWSEHIKSTCKKAKQWLGFIHRHLSQSPPNVRDRIYCAIVLPKLEYCCAVWDPHYVSDIDALESVQKFAGRVITRQWHSDYHTLCSTLNWQPLSVRRKLQKLKVCYNIVNNRSIIPSSQLLSSGMMSSMIGCAICQGTVVAAPAGIEAVVEIKEGLRGLHQGRALMNWGLLLFFLKKVGTCMKTTPMYWRLWFDTLKSNAINHNVRGFIILVCNSLQGSFELYDSLILHVPSLKIMMLHCCLIIMLTSCIKSQCFCSMLELSATTSGRDTIELGGCGEAPPLHVAGINKNIKQRSSRHKHPPQDNWRTDIPVYDGAEERG